MTRTPSWKLWVPILNKLPARAIPPKPVGDGPLTHWAPVHRPPIRVRARIAWETGDEWVESVASVYDPRDGAVYVALGDKRHPHTAVWLHGRDVTPLGPVED